MVIKLVSQIISSEVSLSFTAVVLKKTKHILVVIYI